MLSGVNANKTLLHASGYRTMGELAARHESFAEAKRNKGGSYSHTFARADLVAELRLLFARQRELGNPQADSDFEEAVHTLLMQRKPMMSGDELMNKVGPCTFEKNEKRAPKASYTTERFVWLTRLNNLRISGLGETSALNKAERQLIIQLPFTQAKLTYKQVRKALGLSEHERFVGLRYPRASEGAKDPEEATLFEAKAFHALRKAYEGAGQKSAWQRDALNPERLDTLAYALTAFKDDDESRAWLTAQGMEPVIIEAVLELTFSEFIRLSLKALHKILPHMEAGIRYDEAVQAAGYAHHSRLPTSDKSHYIPRLGRSFVPNPVVSRALNQARKLVNAIVREYGPPSAVHIELARELSKPFDERRKIEKEQKEYRDNKEKDVAAFEETFGFKPRKDWLTKWRLYREQGAKCAYSLDALEIERLFEDGYAELDHALPYSRSFNDGMNNKVLVLTTENRNKGNQTPYEYLDGEDDSERWRAFVAWVEGNKSYRVTKQRNLLRKDFGTEAAQEFRERHLTDTRYIAKEFKRLVETHLQLAGEKESRCVVVSGQLTAYLRARWGLIKVRENGDLHHALDAAVVAACSRSMVKRLSDYSRRGELEFARGNHIDPETGEVLDIEAIRKLEDHFPTPWPYFRDEVVAWLSPAPAEGLAKLFHYPDEIAQSIEPVRVSRAPTRRGLGAAHQETIRSAKCFEDGKSAVKVPLTNLKLDDLKNIVGYADPRNSPLIAAIEQRLRDHGDDGKKAFKAPLHKPSAPGKKAPIIRTVSLLTIQKSGIFIRKGIANNGDMLRVDIFTDGKRFHAVPLYVADAVKDELPNRAVVAYKPEEEWTVMDDNYRFMFSLHPNDWVRILLKGDLPFDGYFAGLDRSTGAISLWAHDRNQAVGKDGLMRGIGIKTALTVEKFHVDFLGRLYKVHQEERKQLKGKG
jgi:CRISPR-associated endonuclease Csn1